MDCGEEPAGWRHDAAPWAGRNATGRIAAGTSEREWHGGPGTGGASRFQWDLEVGAASGSASARCGVVEWGDEAVSAERSFWLSVFSYQRSEIRKQAPQDRNFGDQESITT